MGLDASISRIKFKVNSDLEYDKIRDEKWDEFKLDTKKFYNWEESVKDEILYTSDYSISDIIDKRNIGDKAVCFSRNQDLVLDSNDIQCIIKDLKFLEIGADIELKEMCKKCIDKLEKCLKDTDFSKETLLYGKWN